MVKPNILNIQIAKEWAGSSGDFIKALKGPGVAKPAADANVLTKWLVTGFYLLILTHAVNIGFYVLGPATGGGIVTGITNLISFAIFAFLQTWIVWFSFAKREPSCCFCFIACIEDFQPMHLLYGILLVLNGVSQALTAVQALMGALAALTALAPIGIVTLIFAVLYLLYAVSQICAGCCLVQLGSKKAGVDIPGGAPAEMVGA
jgi:hypothetical protein